MLDYIEMQMRKTNRKKGYCLAFTLDCIVTQMRKTNREQGAIAFIIARIIASPEYFSLHKKQTCFTILSSKFPLLSSGQDTQKYQN